MLGLLVKALNYGLSVTFMFYIPLKLRLYGDQFKVSSERLEPVVAIEPTTPEWINHYATEASKLVIKRFGCLNPSSSRLCALHTIAVLSHMTTYRILEF